MYKDELIHLHQLMVLIKDFLQNNGVAKDNFNDYDELNICPHHIHRTKAEHKYAIFVLASRITKSLIEEEGLRGMSTRLQNLANRIKQNIDKQTWR